MRSILVAVAAVLIFATPSIAAAQDAERAERLALAERAIDAMQGDQMAEMVHQMGQAFPPPNIANMTGDVRVAYDEVMAEASANMMRRMLEGMGGIYADLFTREELLAMVAFYESPVGQSILTKSMAATPQIIELTRTLMPGMMREVINGMCDRLGCTPQERREALRDAMAQIGMTES